MPRASPLEFSLGHLQRTGASSVLGDKQTHAGKCNDASRALADGCHPPLWIASSLGYSFSTLIREDGGRRRDARARPLSYGCNHCFATPKCRSTPVHQQRACGVRQLPVVCWKSTNYSGLRSPHSPYSPAGASKRTKILQSGRGIPLRACQSIL